MGSQPHSPLPQAKTVPSELRGWNGSRCDAQEYYIDYTPKEWSWHWHTDKRGSRRDGKTAGLLRVSRLRQCFPVAAHSVHRDERATPWRSLSGLLALDPSTPRGHAACFPGSAKMFQKVEASWSSRVRLDVAFSACLVEPKCSKRSKRVDVAFSACLVEGVLLFNICLR